MLNVKKLLFLFLLPISNTVLTEVNGNEMNIVDSEVIYELTDLDQIRNALAEYSRAEDKNNAAYEEKRRAMLDSVEMRFLACDTDADDTLDVFEVTQCLPQVARMFRDVDIDSDNVITLDDVINNIDFSTNIKTNTQLYLDIKGNNNNIIKHLIAKLESSYENLNNIILCSFNKKHIDAINVYNNEQKYTINHPKYIKKGFITENMFDIDDLNHLTQNIEYLIFHWLMIDENTIKYCKEHNIKVFCYTCKNKHILEEMLEYKVDGIISDILI